MASIKCGKCKWTHSSVAEVKACYNPVKQTAEVEDGYYRREGQIYKVQTSEHGRRYAKVLEHREGTDEDGNDSQYGAFVYQPGAIKLLRPEMALTLEEAAEFGALYGFCCICGRTLRNEESIERGIGPICLEKMGW